jgi:Protein of unknown function (DUF2029).
MMKKKVSKLVFDFRIILVVYFLVVIVTSLQSYFAHPTAMTLNGILYNHYNNYVIFKQSFFHLISNKDLYILYPYEQWDLYKYSPTFALFMAPMAYMPDFMGLIVWNLINALPLFFAVKYFPLIDRKNKALFLWFVLLELLIAVQNEQSNGLIAGLTILAFLFLEKRNYFVAALLVVFSAYIKLFGIVAFALFLLYPDKWKSALYSIFWFVLLGVLPLITVSAHQLTFLYSSWGKLLAADHSASLGLSVMGWLNSWFSLNPSKNIVVVIGILLFLLPLIRINKYKNLYFRMLLLSSILIWMIIFNHKAESPTFVVAVSGIAIWFFSQEKKTVLSKVFLIATIAFTCLNTSDIYPGFVRDWFFDYTIKAVPCILVWGVVIYEMMTESFYKQGIE